MGTIQESLRGMMAVTTTLAEKLAPYGIDYADAMDRFENAADLYKRLAMKYLQDGRFAALQAAIEVGDFSEGYRQAHALKGVAGNLSFADLFEAVKPVSDTLAIGESAFSIDLLPPVEKAHKRVIEGLLAWQNDEL